MSTENDTLKKLITEAVVDYLGDGYRHIGPRIAKRVSAELAALPGGTPPSQEPRESIVHQCPPEGSGLMPCCGRTPFEVSALDQMTNDKSLVTCAARLPGGSETPPPFTRTDVEQEAASYEDCWGIGPASKMLRAYAATLPAAEPTKEK